MEHTTHNRVVGGSNPPAATSPAFNTIQALPPRCTSFHRLDARTFTVCCRVAVRTGILPSCCRSLMIAIPPEMAAGLGLGEGAAVTLRSHAGVIEIEPADLGERLRAEARQEAARLREGPAYAAEMRAVREDMESVRAW